MLKTPPWCSNVVVNVRASSVITCSTAKVQGRETIEELTERNIFHQIVQTRGKDRGEIFLRWPIFQLEDSCASTVLLVFQSNWKENLVFSLNFSPADLPSRRSNPSQNFVRIIAFVGTGVNVSQSQSAGVSRWSIMCSLNESGCQSCWDRFRWTFFTRTGELAAHTFWKNCRSEKENETKTFGEEKILNVRVWRSCCSTRWKRANVRDRRTRCSNRHYNRSSTKPFGPGMRRRRVVFSDFAEIPKDFLREVSARISTFGRFPTSLKTRRSFDADPQELKGTTIGSFGQWKNELCQGMNSASENDFVCEQIRFGSEEKKFSTKKNFVTNYFCVFLFDIGRDRSNTRCKSSSRTRDTCNGSWTASSNIDHRLLSNRRRSVSKWYFLQTRTKKKNVETRRSARFTFILFRTFVLFVQKHRGEELGDAQQHVLSVDQRHRRLTGRIRFVQPVRFAGVGKFSELEPIFTERF